MKKIFLIFALLIAIASYGQSTFNKLLIGASVSPDICYRSLKSTTGSTTSLWIIDLRNERETPRLGYTAGLSLCYNLSKHWGIETGLQYSRKGEKSVDDDLTFGDQIDPRYGFIYTPSGTSPTKVTFIYSYNYLDIPLRVLFYAGKRKVRFIAGIGVTTNIFINATQRSIVKYDDADTQRSTHDQDGDFMPVNISPTASAGIDYSISEKMSLRVEPTFRYGLLKIIDASITSYLWSGGVNVTWYYALK